MHTIASRFHRSLPDCDILNKNNRRESEQSVERQKLNWLCEISGIHVTLFDGNGLETVHQPIFDLGFAENCIQDFELQGRNIHHPLVLMLDPGYFIGVAQLDDARYAIVGPAAPYAVQREKLYACCGALVASDKMLTFCDELLRTPLCSYRKFAQMVALSIALFGSGEQAVSLEQIVLCNSSQTLRETPEQHLEKNLFFTRENEFRHTSVDWEARLFQSIEQGDGERLKQAMFSNMGGQAGNMSPDPLRQERYMFMSSITQVTRAAVRGGLPQETAYSLSDVYCQRMDALTSVPDISLLMFQMMQDFCERVNVVRKRPRYSQAIQKCCGYIDTHLHEPISLGDLANCCGLCRRTVSIKFKKETGYALPDYIHREKSKEAKYLLENTEYTIAEISAFLQYNSQSYFSKIFREIVGVTPQQFREGKQ